MAIEKRKTGIEKIISVDVCMDHDKEVMRVIAVGRHGEQLPVNAEDGLEVINACGKIIEKVNAELIKKQTLN